MRLKLLAACLVVAGVFDSASCWAASYDVKPSGSSQTAAAPAGAYPASIVAQPRKKLDVACFIDAQQADLRIRRGDMWVVDIRPPESFDNNDSIPRAINVPAYAVATKSFLRSKPVLLVDEGDRPAELAGLCGNLKAKGFREVYALYGGMAAWRQRTARIPADSRLVMMDPADFFQQKDYRYWLVVDATGEAEGHRLFPDALVVRSAKKGWIKRVEAQWQRLRQGQLFPPLVLVIGRDAESMARLESNLKHVSQPMLVFAFADGLQGYRDFLQRQSLVWQHEQAPMQQGNRCTY